MLVSRFLTILLKAFLLLLILPKISLLPYDRSKQVALSKADQYGQDLLTLDESINSDVSSVNIRTHNIMEQAKKSDVREGVRVLETKQPWLSPLLQQLQNIISSNKLENNRKGPSSMPQPIKAKQLNVLGNDDDEVSNQLSEQRIRPQRNRRDTKVTELSEVSRGDAARLNTHIGIDIAVERAEENIELEINESRVLQEASSDTSTTLLNNWTTTTSTTEADVSDVIMASPGTVDDDDDDNSQVKMGVAGMKDQGSSSLFWDQVKMLKDFMQGLEERVRELEDWTEGQQGKEEADHSEEKVDRDFVYEPDAFTNHGQMTSSCHSVHAHVPRFTKVYQLLASDYFIGRKAKVWLSENMDSVKDKLDLHMQWCEDPTHLTDTLNLDCVVLSKVHTTAPAFCLQPVSCESEQNIICVNHRDNTTC